MMQQNELRARESTSGTNTIKKKMNIHLLLFMNDEYTIRLVIKIR